MRERSGDSPRGNRLLTRAALIETRFWDSFYTSLQICVRITLMPPPKAMRCLDCGYDLRRLPENRCPECGRPFDPAEPRTVDDGTRLFQSHPLLLALIGAAASLGGTLGLVVGTASGGSNTWFGILIVCVLAGWLMAAHSLSLCVRDLRRPYCPIRRQLVAGLILNIFALCPLLVVMVPVVPGADIDQWQDDWTERPLVAAPSLPRTMARPPPCRLRLIDPIFQLTAYGLRLTACSFSTTGNSSRDGWSSS